MPRVVIIGAGLTGISTAYHLERNGFSDYLMIEKESSVGGLCRSISQDGYTFDYTGHLLHTSDAYFTNLIHTIIGHEHFNVIDRQSFIYSYDRYTPYPYQMHLKSLPSHVIADCLQGFIQRKKKKNIRTFVDWVLQQFGAGFAQHFFIPYQTKIFATDPHTITASWTSRFVPEVSLENIIDGLQGITKSTGYNASFIYPKRGGIISWVQQLADQIQKPIMTDTALSQVYIKSKTVTLNSGEVIPYDTLINTIPLDIFLSLTKDRSNSFLATAADKLQCNSVINFNLGIAERIISDKHWIYFPENQYAFYRLGFPHNFAASMAPAGCSSLYGEFAYMKKSAAWVKKTTTEAITQAKKLLAIADSEIATTSIIPISHAYVTYDQWRERNLSRLLGRLAGEQIHSIGRYGGWKYSSMQEAVLDGKAMAETIVEKESLTTVPTNHVYQTKENLHVNARHTQQQRTY